MHNPSDTVLRRPPPLGCLPSLPPLPPHHCHNVTHRPTDAAIESFLKDMGLTVDDLKKRPTLAKSLVAQHTLLRSNGAFRLFLLFFSLNLSSLSSPCTQSVADLHPRAPAHPLLIMDSPVCSYFVAGEVSVRGSEGMHLVRALDMEARLKVSLSCILCVISRFVPYSS